MKKQKVRKRWQVQIIPGVYEIRKGFGGWRIFRAVRKGHRRWQLWSMKDDFISYESLLGEVPSFHECEALAHSHGNNTPERVCKIFKSHG